MEQSEEIPLLPQNEFWWTKIPMAQDLLDVGIGPITLLVEDSVIALNTDGGIFIHCIDHSLCNAEDSFIAPVTSEGVLSFLHIAYNKKTTGFHE